LLNWSKGQIVSNQLDFKVLHLSTSHAGGAGIAALRLHRSLFAKGVNSHFLTLENSDFHPQANEVVLTRSLSEKFLSKLTALLSNNLFKSTYFTLFSTPVLTPSRLAKSGFGQDSVLHIHNWFNLTSIRQMRLLLRNGYRLIVTLHDQRFFTGGCHYSLKCDEYIRKCEKCPLLPNKSLNFVIRKNHKNLSDLVAKYNNQIIFLAPSKWIESEARRSSILKGSKILFQPNLHTEFEIELNYSEKSLGTNYLDSFSVGVASMDSSSPLKGSDYVLKIMEVLGSENDNFLLKQLSQYPQTKEGYLNFWREIDCLLVLSRADNSPNVIHESKVAGVPIIGTNVGGIPELLNQSFDFIFENDVNLVKNVSRAIIMISKRSQAMPKEIDLRYESPNSRGNIDGFLNLYSDFN
jgi:glycosyltransferase involved in cell wall biosynthesis